MVLRPAPEHDQRARCVVLLLEPGDREQGHGGSRSGRGHVLASLLLGADTSGWWVEVTRDQENAADFAGSAAT